MWVKLREALTSEEQIELDKVEAASQADNTIIELFPAAQSAADWLAAEPSTILSGAFAWHRTEQGYEYWHDIGYRLMMIEIGLAIS